MRVFKNLIVAALLIGSLLLGMLVASVTACTGIRLTATDGTVLQETLFDNAFSPPNQWVLREITLSNLAPYQGQALRINFKAVTDASLLTSFYLDNVSITPSSP